MFRFCVRAMAGILLLLTSSLGQQAAKGPSPAQAQSKSSAGETVSGIYRNPAFGFSCKIPFGWVERTREMQEPSADHAKEQVLLAVFEHPPEATGSTVNSAIVIAAESAKSYPGLKTAADYFGPLEEVTTAKGFKVVNEPYEFSLDGKLLVRGDFTQDRGSVTLYQSSLVMLSKGYIVSFTFIAASEDDMNDLSQRLSFPRPRPGPAAHKR